MKKTASDLLLTTYVAIATLAMLFPIAIVIGTSLTPRAFLEFPPSGLDFKWYVSVLSSSTWTGSLLLSFQIAALSTCTSLLLGVPAALALRKISSRWSVTLQTFFLSPLMIPNILIGLALLRTFEQLGIRPSIVTLAIGHTIISMPYIVRYVLASLAGVDPALERAARIHGATALRAFRTVTLPLINHGVIAGALFAAIVSLDDVNVTLFLSRVQLQPFSFRLLGYVQQSANPLGAAAASLLVLIALALLFACDRIVGINWLFGIKSETR